MLDRWNEVHRALKMSSNHLRIARRETSRTYALSNPSWITNHLQTSSNPNPTWKYWAKSDCKWSDRIIPESLPNHLTSFFAQGLCTQYCMSGLKRSRGAMKGDRVASITHAESSQTEKEKKTKPTEFGTKRHKNTPGDARPTRTRLFRPTKQR